MLRRLLLSLALTCFQIIHLSGQASLIPTRGLTLSYTLTHERFYDERLSFRERTGPGFMGGISFFWQKGENLHTITMSFEKNRTNRGAGIVNFDNLRPRLTYHRQQKIGNFYLGGALDLGTLLSFPKSRGSWQGNNNISYTMWSSLGLVASFRQPISERAENTHFFSTLTVPLIGYVIRPAFGLPYPERFLEDETFDFQRQGLTGALLRSGNIRSITDFQNIDLQAGVSTALAKGRYRIGIAYQLNYLRIKEDKSVRMFRNGLQLSSILNLGG